MNQIDQRLFEIVESIRDGGGEELGAGLVTFTGYSLAISMTAATECYWGMSGRGNPNAKRNIEIAASNGLLRIVGNKRKQVSITPAGYKFLAKHTKGETDAN